MATHIEIEGLLSGPFTPEEIHEIGKAIAAVSVVDGNHFEAIEFHVNKIGGKSLHLPPTMILNLFPAIGAIIDGRRLARLEAESAAAEETVAERYAREGGSVAVRPSIRNGSPRSEREAPPHA